MQLLHLIFLEVSYKNSEISPFQVMFEIDVVKQYETK